MMGTSTSFYLKYPMAKWVGRKGLVPKKEKLPARMYTVAD
jgi:hypothetical protein